MSYTPTNWQTGDTITAEKLNNMENGIENGQTLVVTITQNGGVYVADKTFSEITSAWSAGKIVIADASAVGTTGVLYLTKVNASSVLFSSARGADIHTIMMSSGGTINPSHKFNLYSKPSTGIPQTDLAQAVQNKLDPFAVTLTPTAQDYSGTMDKTVGEIKDAYKAKQKIVFRVMSSATEYVEVPASAMTYNSDDDTLQFNVYVLMTSSNALVLAYNGGLGGSDDTYDTVVYTLTPMS